MCDDFDRLTDDESVAEGERTTAFHRQVQQTLELKNDEIPEKSTEIELTMVVQEIQKRVPTHTSGCAGCKTQVAHSQLFVCTLPSCGFTLKNRKGITYPELFYEKEFVFCGNCSFMGIHKQHSANMVEAMPLAKEAATNTVGVLLQKLFDQLRVLNQSDPLESTLHKVLFGDTDGMLPEIHVMEYLMRSDTHPVWTSRLVKLQTAANVMLNLRQEGRNYFQDFAKQLGDKFKNLSDIIDNDIVHLKAQDAETIKYRYNAHTRRMGEVVVESDESSPEYSRVGSPDVPDTVEQIDDLAKQLQLLDEEVGGFEHGPTSKTSTVTSNATSHNQKYYYQGHVSTEKSPPPSSQATVSPQNAPNAAQNAQNHAQNAQNPQNYAQNGQNHFQNAQNYAQNAQNYAQNAQNYAQSAQNAQNVAQNAQNVAQNAQNVAQNAQNVAQNAQNAQNHVQNGGNPVNDSEWKPKYQEPKEKRAIPSFRLAKDAPITFGQRQEEQRIFLEETPTFRIPYGVPSEWFLRSTGQLAKHEVYDPIKIMEDRKRKYRQNRHQNNRNRAYNHGNFRDEPLKWEEQKKTPTQQRALSRNSLKVEERHGPTPSTSDPQPSISEPLPYSYYVNNSPPLLPPPDSDDSSGNGVFYHGPPREKPKSEVRKQHEEYMKGLEASKKIFDEKTLKTATELVRRFELIRDHSSLEYALAEIGRHLDHTDGDDLFKRSVAAKFKERTTFQIYWTPREPKQEAKK